MIVENSLVKIKKLIKFNQIGGKSVVNPKQTPNSSTKTPQNLSQSNDQNISINETQVNESNNVINNSSDQSNSESQVNDKTFSDLSIDGKLEFMFEKISEIEGKLRKTNVLNKSSKYDRRPPDQSHQNYRHSQNNRHKQNWNQNGRRNGFREDYGKKYRNNRNYSSNYRNNYRPQHFYNERYFRPSPQFANNYRNPYPYILLPPQQPLNNGFLGQSQTNQFVGQQNP